MTCEEGARGKQARSATAFVPYAFEQFKRDRAADFERIARKTRGNHDPDDLKSEAWLIAIEIGKRRGGSVDLSNHAEQEQVLAWLYQRCVVFVRGKHKESIDQEFENGPAWHDRLAAPDDADPLVQLTRIDDELACAPAMKGFSEYSAYIVLLGRCEMNVHKLADYLSVSFTTLRRRIQVALECANRQPSLFDGVEDVDMQFVPKAAWMKRLCAGWHVGATWLKGCFAARRDPEQDPRATLNIQMGLV